jgi:hypothetical protein
MIYNRIHTSTRTHIAHTLLYAIHTNLQTEPFYANLRPPSPQAYLKAAVLINNVVPMPCVFFIFGVWTRLRASGYGKETTLARWLD